MRRLYEIRDFPNGSFLDPDGSLAPGDDAATGTTPWLDTRRGARRGRTRAGGVRGIELAGGAAAPRGRPAHVGARRRPPRERDLVIALEPLRRRERQHGDLAHDGGDLDDPRSVDL